MNTKHTIGSLLVAALLAVCSAAGVEAKDIVASQLGTGSVTSIKILDQTVSAADIDTGAVGTSEVADQSLGTADIDTNGVGASEIATGAVGTLEVADESLGAADLDTSSVGTLEVIDGSIVNADVSATAAITYSKLLFSNSIVADDVATGGVGSAEVLDESLGAADLDTNSVGTLEIGPDVIVAEDIATGGVASAEVLDESLGAADLDTNSVGTLEIAPDVIVAEDIATGGVGSLEVLDQSLAAADIDTGAVGTSEILDGTIGTGDVAVGAIAASVGGRALLASGIFDEATVDDKVAASAIDDDRLKALGTTRKLGGRDDGRAAVGYVYLTGVVADAQTVVINSRTYEFDTGGGITGDVTVDVTADQTADAACTALRTAINADAGVVYYAGEWTGNDDVTSGITLVANTAQATNYTLSETMANGVVSAAAMTGAAVATNRSLWAYSYTATAADVTSWAGAGGDEVVIGAVTSTTSPTLVGLVARDTNGVVKSLATVIFRVAQINANFYVLLCEDGNAVLASGDVIGFTLEI